MGNQKIEWLSRVPNSNQINNSEKYKDNREFEDYMSMYYGNEFNLTTIPNDTREKVLENFRQFILRLCWKMCDTLPFNDKLLEYATCLIPSKFDYEKWTGLAKQFEKNLPGKFIEFVQQI